MLKINITPALASAENSYSTFRSTENTFTTSDWEKASIDHYFTEIFFENKILLFNEENPLKVTIIKDGNHEVFCEQLNIYSFGSDYSSAIASFMEDVIFIYDEIVREDDENLEINALKLKYILKSMIKGVVIR